MAAAATITYAQTLATESVLHSFASVAQRGADPNAVIHDTAGNSFGTTTYGGAANAGVVFKVDAAGRQTVLHNFSGGADGGYPYAPVVQDRAGNLYGTTSAGGGAGQGVLFKLDTAARYSVLHSFTGGNDGGVPFAELTLEAGGNLYGTASQGGTGSGGVVFRLDAAGGYAVQYSFMDGADGAGPMAGVVRDKAGNLFGTTYRGGTGNAGVVYKLDPAGRETVLYSFTGGADGANPRAGVILDAAGNLYGTTFGGGAYLNGTVFTVDSAGHETVLHSFGQDVNDGSTPYAGLIRDAAGNLYGTTYLGNTSHSGVIYRLDAAGHETLLYSFTGGADGANPTAGVIMDAAGNLYGTTLHTGGGSPGTLYKLDTVGQLTTQYTFPNVLGGDRPYAGVTLDSGGNLFGTTSDGGITATGVVFKLDATGHYAVLHNFGAIGDGGDPEVGVIVDQAGNLYGTTRYGGAMAKGVVYKLDPAGEETILYSFTGRADGRYPLAGVIRDSFANLYGTTSEGGACGAGVVFKLDAAGHETVLYNFTGGSDGGEPRAGVIFDSAGSLFGTTYSGGTGSGGVVYKLDAAHHYSTLYSFTGGADGGRPTAGVILDPAGDLYGTTYQGGTPVPAQGIGVVFKVDAAGHETVLYSFSGGSDGANPAAGVVRDAAGNLYGSTVYGGAANAGVVYRLDAAGQYSVLYSFTGTPGGAHSFGGVVLDPAGNLYGTTTYGGKKHGGVIFKITPQ